jgi:hypothetical protein
MLLAAGALVTRRRPANFGPPRDLLAPQNRPDPLKINGKILALELGKGY